MEDMLYAKLNSPISFSNGECGVPNFRNVN